MQLQHMNSSYSSRSGSSTSGSSRTSSRSSSNNSPPRRTVRFRVSEIQKAERGRKFATADRRPLDPPPVASLRIFDVYNTGTAWEQHVLRLPTDELTRGMVCVVDLLPVIEEEHLNNIAGPSSQAASGPGSSRGRAVSPQLSSFSRTPDTQNHNMDGVDGMDGMASTSTSANAANTAESYALPQVGSPRGDLIAGGTAIDANIVDWNGERQTMFVFSDLAVKAVGTFLLHYCVFNITHVNATQREAAIATCYGGPFVVHSTKDFPGLGPSTDLTKACAYNSIFKFYKCIRAYLLRSYSICRCWVFRSMPGQ